MCTCIMKTTTCTLKTQKRPLKLCNCKVCIVSTCRFPAHPPARDPHGNAAVHAAVLQGLRHLHLSLARGDDRYNEWETNACRRNMIYMNVASTSG